MMGASSFRFYNRISIRLHVDVMTNTINIMLPYFVEKIKFFKNEQQERRVPRGVCYIGGTGNGVMLLYTE